MEVEGGEKCIQRRGGGEKEEEGREEKQEGNRRSAEDRGTQEHASRREPENTRCI